MKDKQLTRVLQFKPKHNRAGAVTPAESEDNMTDNEAYKLIVDRAEELSKITDVQKKIVEIAEKDGKSEAEKWLYRCAIATLI